VLLRKFLVGFYGFASFCFVLAVGLDPLSTGAAFLAAIAAALVVQSSVLAFSPVGLRSRDPALLGGRRVRAMRSSRFRRLRRLARLGR
jgi:hypothetical protein